MRLKVSVIVSPGPALTRPAKEATSANPIVMAQDTDPGADGANCGQMMTAMKSMGNGDLDHAALVRFVEELAKTELSGRP